MARGTLARVLALPGGDPDELGALERVPCCHEDAEQREESAVERTVSDPEIFEADAFAAQDAEDHEHADDEEYNNRCDFNDSEPIFGLPIAFDGQKFSKKMTLRKSRLHKNELLSGTSI